MEDSLAKNAHANDAAAGKAPVSGSLIHEALDAVRQIGFSYATIVALVIGLPFSTGAVKTRGDLIVLRGLPKWAYRRGGTTIGRVYLTDDNASDDVLEHELVHVEQWRRHGFLFPLLYWWAGDDPHRNRFEVEAGLEKGGYLR